MKEAYEITLSIFRAPDLAIPFGLEKYFFKLKSVSTEIVPK
jgi:hypothetical protein